MFWNSSVYQCHELFTLNHMPLKLITHDKVLRRYKPIGHTWNKHAQRLRYIYIKVMTIITPKRILNRIKIIS